MATKTAKKKPRPAPVPVKMRKLLVITEITGYGQYGVMGCQAKAGFVEVPEDTVVTYLDQFGLPQDQGEKVFGLLTRVDPIWPERAKKKTP